MKLWAVFVVILFLSSTNTTCMNWFFGCCSSGDVSEVRNKALLQKMLYAMLTSLPKELIALIVEYDLHELQGKLFKTLKIGQSECIMMLGKLGPKNVISIADNLQVRLFDIETGEQVHGFKLWSLSYGFIQANGRLLIIGQDDSFYVCLYEVESTHIIAKKELLPYQKCVELSNGWLAKCKDNDVVVKNGNKIVKKFKTGDAKIDCCCCADDGSFITAGQQSIKIWR